MTMDVVAYQQVMQSAGSNEGQAITPREGCVMGQSRKRTGQDGRPRYTAYYQDIAGRRRSAGTFSSQRQADKTWQRAETKVAEGRMGDPRRSRQTFRRYVEEEWLPNHLMELTTRQNYTYQLHRRILPTFGDYPMAEILPSHVREWVTSLQRLGVNPPTIKYCMTVLSAIFTTALTDQITFLHPCMGVRTPPVTAKPRRIITPEQFARIYEALPTRDLRLLVEMKVETGLRWGELTELRVHDVNWQTGVLTISRVAVEIPARFHPDGQRFVVKPYPKDKEWRRLGLSQHIFQQLVKHAKRFAGGDLLFCVSQPTEQRLRPRHAAPQSGTWD
jgi:integrase